MDLIRTIITVSIFGKYKNKISVNMATFLEKYNFEISTS